MEMLEGSLVTIPMSLQGGGGGAAFGTGNQTVFATNAAGQTIQPSYSTTPASQQAETGPAVQLTGALGQFSATINLSPHARRSSQPPAPFSLSGSRVGGA
jgi:hypothetical protein